ncbi:hypothetical protein ACFPK9_08915 [Rubritalea spongiae]|uniref:Chemotaxis methyl-accepting receptor HlyB-like 4HB MCP domain-containing protein n=1 Tax=Rubritalea spongiae TaxID=430797 RepID=A0ABW5E0S0_9BACT
MNTLSKIFLSIFLIGIALFCFYVKYDGLRDYVIQADKYAEIVKRGASSMEKATGVTSAHSTAEELRSLSDELREMKKTMRLSPISNDEAKEKLQTQWSKLDRAYISIQQSIDRIEHNPEMTQILEKPVNDFLKAADDLVGQSVY